MKRILLALTIVGLLLPLAPRAEADAEVSLNFFYDNLSPYGSWIEVSDYGYCFQPNVAVGSSDWRPYADGYWAYTDAGWTWVSYEDFGWATYHYGRWADLEDYGWVWVPGYEWGPAWVSWRTGGDYVGWAPLPPQPGEVVYEGRAITGAVDVSFDIGPLYYNFVDIRYIGEPVLRGHLIQPRQNITIINQTVNVTNITYNNSVVFNNGPDINRLNRYSTRPIQRLKLQRETTISGDVGRRGNLNRVNGSELVVAAPAVQRSKEKLAPKQVKTRVDKPRVERGWRGVDNRKQVEETMKKENAQNVPPPTFQPKEGGKGQNAGAQPNEQGQPAQGAAENANKQSAAERQAPRADEQQARQNERQQAQEQKKNAQPGGQKAEKTDERRAQQNDRQQQREAAQQEKEQRQAQQTDEQRQSRQAEQAQTRQNQQEEQQRAPGKNKAQRAERQQQQEQSANDRQQKAERAQRAESQQADRARQRAEQGQQADQAQRHERAQDAQRGRQAERPQRPERPQQAPPERRQQQQAQPPQGQGDQQQPDEERKGKKKRPNDEQPQP